MKKSTLISVFLYAALILFIYRNWFFSSIIIGGDWPYIHSEQINAFTFFPPAWNSMHGGGFGGPHIVYALDTYLYSTAWLFSNVLNIPWEIVQKVFWFGMVLALGTYSMYRLIKKLLPDIPALFSLLGSFIYLTNTYILLVLGGGQMGVGLGYAVAPFVLLSFIRLIQQTKQQKNNMVISKPLLQHSLIAGLFFALQVLFDFRIAYITLAAIFIYFILNVHWRIAFKNSLKIIRNFSLVFIIPFVLTALLHMFWLLPFFFIGQQSVAQLGSGYTSTDAVKFFSFAQFENALGLLHPNWPENIFGKVGFMKAEFLVLPLLAFSSLLFLSYKSVTSEQKQTVIFFALIALLGAFFAKGANDPFGSIYLWLFDTIPGFVMFRDPTKWYILVALAYSVLIPLSIHLISERLRSNKRLKFLSRYNLLVILTLGLMLFLIRPVLMGELGGTFRNRSVPAEYVVLKDTLVKDETFSRSMWLPKMQRFGFTSQNHPAVEAESVLNATNSADMIKQIKKEGAEKKLFELSIEYIVVPYDPEKEIFLEDRKYDKQERDTIVKELNKLTWLQKDNRFAELSVYYFKNHKDRLWLQQNGNISYNRVSSTEYVIQIETTVNNTLIFNESYSPYWKLRVGDKQLQSKNYNGMNSFDFPEMQNDVKLVYSLREYYEIGRIISSVIMLTLLGILILRKKEYK